MVHNNGGGSTDCYGCYYSGEVYCTGRPELGNLMRAGQQIAAPCWAGGTHPGHGQLIHTFYVPSRHPTNETANSPRGKRGFPWGGT